MKTVEKIILVIVLVLLVAGVFVALRNIDFFNVKQIDVSVNGPVTKVSADMQRVLNPLKGMNIFEVNIRSLRRTLEAFDGVAEAGVKRFFPDRLIIEINYNEVDLKTWCLTDDGEIQYYFYHDGVLEKVGQSTWDEFDMPGIVELSPAYTQMTVKWGCDAVFAEMAVLVEHLAGNNLISNIKYDNNNGNEFGKLVIDLSSLNSVLYVRELVSVQRLDEALELISSQFSAGGAQIVYDLYANALGRRT